MRITSLLLFVLVFIFAGFAPSLLALGSPLEVFGTILNADGSVPPDSTISFKAYIVSRPAEIQTQTSPGCGYGSGSYQVQLGNFPTPWSAGEKLILEFRNTANGQYARKGIIITSGGGALSENIQLEITVITFSHETGFAGEDIQVKVYTSNLYGIAGFNIDFIYDADLFTAENVIRGTSFSENFISNLTTPGKVRLALAMSTGLANSESGEIAVIRCHILPGVTGDYPLTFTRVKLYDENAAEIASHATDGLVSIVPDTTAPTGSIVINSGDDYTNDETVTLTLEAFDIGTITEMKFSADNLDWSSEPIPYSTIHTFSLPSCDGSKTVYVKFRDAAGNWSAPVSDTIMLDTVKPVTTPSKHGGTYNEPQVITLSADAGSSIYYTLDGTDPRTSATRLLYNSSVPISIDVSTTLRHYAVDSAGNAGDVSTDTYTIQFFIINAVDLIRIVQGDTKPVTLTFTGIGGFGTQVNLSHAYEGDVPSGASVNLSTYAAIPTLAGTDITLYVGAASGTPPGTYTLRITAAGEGLTETKNIQVMVLLPLAIGFAAVTDGVVRKPYTLPVEVSGGILPYTFTRASGSLPGGLVLNADGTISGIPEARGTSSFTILVQDSDGHSASKDYAIRVYDPAYRRLTLESPAWTLEKGTLSGWITARVMDDYGQNAKVSANTMIGIVSSSEAGRFTLDGASFSSDNTLSPTIPAGYSSALFKYKDTMADAFSLTVHGIADTPSAAWKPLTQPFTVTLPNLKNATLTIDSLVQNTTYGQGLMVTGMLKDSQTGSPLGYKTVTLTFTSSSGVEMAKTVATSSDGSYSFMADISILDIAGDWGLQVSFRDADPAQYNDAAASTSFSIARADTRITLNVDVGSTTPNGQVTVSGQLSSFTTVAVDLSGISIILDFVEPDGTTVHSATVVTYDEFGHFTYTYAYPFASLGLWSIHARLAGTTSFNSSVSETENLIVATAPGYAILIQGDSAGQYRDNYAVSLDDIYKKLLRRSFTDENIYYLSYSGATHDTGVTVDALTSRQTIEYAITTWAPAQIAQGGIAPLYIVLMDHGSEKTFYLDPESITPADLNGWITTLEDAIQTNLRQDLTTVIVDGSCHSGSFIPGLSKTGRIVITSSAEDEESAQGPVSYSKTYGEYFVYYLFRNLTAGSNFQDAFKDAAKLTHNWRICNGSACGSNSLSGQGNTKQHPLLDDNGDGRGSWMNVVGQEDGAETERLVLGMGANPALVSITEAMPTAKLPAGTTSLTAWAKTSDPSRTAASWVEIRKPSYVPPDSGGTGQVIMNLPKIAGVYSTTNGRWEYALSNLDEPGTYTLYYYIMDNSDDVQPPVMGAFYINEDGNQPPVNFDLIDPVADQEANDAMMVFRWQDMADPDGDAMTYTLRFYADVGGTKGAEIKSYELIPQVFFYMNALQEKQNDGVTSLFTTGNSYWWEVEAIDEKGATTVSVARRFHVVFTNALNGIITGIVYSDLDYSRIAAATLTANIGGINVNIPVTNGAFVLSVRPGTLALAGAAEGYESAVVSDVNVLAGMVTTMDVSMTAAVLQTYAITSSPGVNGMLTPTATVNHGGSHTFTITPDANYHVTDVLVDGVSVGAVTSYGFTNVTAVHTISASFAINTYSLAVAKTGTGTGSVASASTGIACGDDCHETYDHGTHVVLTEVPGPKSIFTGWTGCDRVDGNDCILSMTADRDVTAKFLTGMKGDLDGNLVVDLSDFILAMQILSRVSLQEGVQIAPVAVADVNNDGRIGIEEMVYILQSITGVR
jgi:hypothetical protein